jgi:hypothetical protein
LTHISPHILNIKAIVGLLCLLLAMVALVFVPARTLEYWQARIPMYAAATVMLLGVPIARGSWLGLRGYTQYQQTLRRRLIPQIW